MVVDENGHATWRSFLSVQYGDLILSAKAGAVNGDPLRPYLINGPQIGDGIMPVWQALLEMWDVLAVVLQTLATAHGGAEAVKWLTEFFRRSKAAGEVMEEHGPRWELAGATPYTFDEWLDDKAWHTSDLAALLGCTVREAELMLWAFGFAQAPSGLWRRGQTEEAKLMAGNRSAMITVGYDRATEKQLADEFGKRVEHYIATGEAPPVPRATDLEWLKPPAWTRALVAAEEERGIVGKITGRLRRRGR